MHLSPLQPTDAPHFFVSGNVTIHPSAAIASGALLQADPGSKLIIGAGTCIGMGAVVHVHQGTLEIETGVNLGSGVLIVGNGRIGANACIGSMTTVFDCSVEPMQIIPPGSLIGNTGRLVAAPPELALEDPAEDIDPAVESPAAPSSSDSSNQVHQAEDSSITSKPAVYGLKSYNQLMSKLFPYKAGQGAGVALGDDTMPQPQLPNHFSNGHSAPK